MDRIAIEKIIYEVMYESLAIDVSGISPSDDLADLDVDTDDWSDLFVPDLQKRLGVSVPVKEWGRATTVSRMAEMLTKYVTSVSAR